MRVIYLSHPYGNKNENLIRADNIALNLVKKYPNDLIVHPLRACGWAYNDLDYEVGLEYCLRLLSRCDEMWVCEGWESSKGCNTEITYCKNNNIPYKFI